jgi:hypothetical protein
MRSESLHVFSKIIHNCHYLTLKVMNIIRRLDSHSPAYQKLILGERFINLFSIDLLQDMEKVIL